MLVTCSLDTRVGTLERLETGIAFELLAVGFAVSDVEDFVVEGCLSGGIGFVV